MFAIAREIAWPPIRGLVVPAEEIAFTTKPCVTVTSNGKADKKDGLAQETLKALVEMSYSLERVYRRGDVAFADVEVTHPVDFEVEHQVQMKIAFI